MRKLSDEEKIEIVRRYLNYESVVTIAKNYNIFPFCVYNLVKVRGLKREFIKKHSFDETIFDNINTEEKAYWLGFIFGDGSIDKHSRYLKIELNNIDRPHIYKFKNFLKGTQEVKETVKNCAMISICNKKFCLNLSKYNIIPNKTYLADSLPLSNIDKELRIHFIRGLFDADGWVTHKIRKNKVLDCQYGFSSYHMNILTQVTNFLEENNIFTNYLIERKRKNQKVCQLIVHGNKSFDKLTSLIYNKPNIYLDRKQEKINYYIQTIKEQRPIIEQSILERNRKNSVSRREHNQSKQNLS